MGKMQFWGTVEGRGKEVARGGTKASGLVVEAAGWKGRIVVSVFHDEMKGCDMFEVYLDAHWNDAARGENKLIASGVLDERALEDPFIPALIA